MLRASFCLWPCLLASLLPASRALGVDGVVEINARSASVGGITPGDSPGFPVTISRSGSYRLTGDLLASRRALVLVDITAERVTLDLNGFTVGACVSSGACVTGIASTIRALVDDVQIRNGVVTGAGGTCVLGGTRAVLQDLRISKCASGISAGFHSQISHVSVSDSIGIGVSMGRGALLKDSTISGSDGPAVRVSFSAWLIDNVIRDNAGAMTSSGGGSFTIGGYRGCLITENDGINEVQPIGGSMRNMGRNICGSDTICP